MSSTTVFWEGYMFLIIGVIYAIIMVFIVGVAVDGTIGGLEMVDALDIPDPWRSSSNVDLYFWQKFAYIIAISPAILGVIAQIVAAVRRERVEEEYGTVQFSEEV